MITPVKRTQRRFRICQGDIIRDVEYLEDLAEKDGVLEISRVTFPLVIVLTQDCDLEQDRRFRTDANLENQDKRLFSVLVAPLYNSQHLLLGEHLLDLQLTAQRISKKKTWPHIRNNEMVRYHYLEFPSETGLVPSIVDFKHYFSVNLTYLEERKRRDFVCTLKALHREEVLHRFAAFLSRIGLPAPTI